MKLIYNESHIMTEGLIERFGWELKITIKQQSIEEYSSIVNYILHYIETTSVIIGDQETISYNSWLLKFIRDGLWLVLWEADENGRDFIEGVDYAIRISKEQLEECKKQNVLPNYPTFSQKIVISKGVYEGFPLEAVRYPSPNHMTGWWLTTDHYDNDIKSLQTVHFFHVAFKRKDILKYLALPFGYRISENGDVQIRFDNQVLE